MPNIDAPFILQIITIVFSAGVMWAIHSLKADLHKEIAEAKMEFHREIANARLEFKNEIANARLEFKNEIANARLEFKNEISELRNDIGYLKGRLDAPENKLT